MEAKVEAYKILKYRLNVNKLCNDWLDKKACDLMTELM